MTKSGVPTYDAKYAAGGWHYREMIEEKHLKVMLSAADITPPASIVEVACGMGFHTNLLHKMGFDAVGNDYSEIGIQKAKERYPDVEFHWGDSRELANKIGHERFDALITQGHSHHHYDLPVSGKNRKGVDVASSTRTMFDLLKPNGAFIMTIRTNFQGDDYKDGVVNNELGAYLKFFSLFGEIIHCSDINGTIIKDDAHARKLGLIPDNRILLVVRKPG